VRVTQVRKGEASEEDIDLLLSDEAGENMTRADAREYLKNEENAPRFKTWGPNDGVPGTYKEIVLTVPVGGEPFDASKVKIVRNRSSVTQGTVVIYYAGEKLAGPYGDSGSIENDYMLPEAEVMELAKSVYERGDVLPDGVVRHPGKQGNYRSTHWDEMNPIAHALYDEIRIPLGKLAETHPELAAKLKAEGKTEARALRMIEGQGDAQQRVEALVATVAKKAGRKPTLHEIKGWTGKDVRGVGGSPNLADKWDEAHAARQLPMKGAAWQRKTHNAHDAQRGGGRRV